MRYTKYNYKKKNNLGKLTLSLIITTCVALIIGLIGAEGLIKIIPKLTNNVSLNLEDVNASVNSKTENDNGTVVISTKNFSIVQCGYFSKEENAKQVINKIGSSMNAFFVKEEEKYRVVASISETENMNEIVEKLKSNGVDSTKVNIKLNKDDKIQMQIGVITDGYLQILNTTSSEEVKGINTNAFKSWVDSLGDVKEGENLELLKEYKAHIKSLPEKISKENVSEQMQYIYKVLQNFKV